VNVADSNRPGPESRLGRLVFLATWLLTVAWLLPFVFRGWIPHDEGTLAQAAERVLQGELSHVDFDDPYAGGLAWLYAGAFLILGSRLASIRMVLLLFSVVFLACLYRVARRAAPPFLAAGATLLAFAWSLPNYFAGLPSWYNLFCAAFSIWALLRHLETSRRRWLLLAGLLAGLSCLAKVTGLYLVAAALLFLVYHEEELTRAGAGTVHEARPGSRWMLALKAIAGLLFVALLVRLVWPVLISTSPGQGLNVVLHFVLPGSAIAGFLVWSEWRANFGGPAGRRLGRLAGLIVPFAAGAAAPVLAFVAPYLWRGQLDALHHGLWVLPQLRFQHAAFGLPPPATLITVLPLALSLALPAEQRRGRRLAFPLAVALLACLVWGGQFVVYQLVWSSLTPMIPLVVMLALWRLRPTGALELEARRRQELFLVLAVAGVTSLVQFPYSYGAYFFYVAPLLVLALLFVVSGSRRGPRPLLAVWAAFYLAFALLWVHTGSPRAAGLRWVPVRNDTPLQLPRAGLEVPDQEARIYEGVVRRVWQHASPGDSIYAAPDCPEVYFLAGMKNPTRALFDFFDPSFADRELLLRKLEENRVKVVVLNLKPSFSPTPGADLQATLARRYPDSERVGKFVVMW
jgi:hypothetical protein